MFVPFPSAITHLRVERWHSALLIFLTTTLFAKPLVSLQTRSLDYYQPQVQKSDNF
jgi:hypothetical protein